MTNKLEEARKIINEVDTQMAELFIKRMKASEAVYEYYRNGSGLERAKDIVDHILSE